MKVSNNLQKEDIAHLIKLHESFPFFQVPKVLLAKYEFEKSGGKRIGVKPLMFEIDKIEAVDIDEPQDFIIAEALFKLLS